MIVCLWLALLFVAFTGHINPAMMELRGYDSLLGWVFLPFAMLLLYVPLFVLAPRLKDVGLPRLLALLVLVPCVNGLLCLVLIFLRSGLVWTDSRRGPPRSW
jgi:uncharacterized membrane protein YhaH (DUF805 family)